MGVYYSEGKYLVECKEVAFSASKKGQPMLVTTVQVKEQIDDDGSSVEVRNYEKRIYTVIDEEDVSGMDRAVAKIRGTGFQGTKMEEFPKWLSGRQFHARCYHSVNKQEGQYKGQEQENWDFWTESKGLKPVESKPELAKKLNAILGSRLKETATKTAPVKAVQPAGDSANIPDDEVPF